ncbi:hypothetical protein HAX54_031751 [Datura stramonium]|uniref:Uncharacterized protein n=1 Tax=Datura stramonium TaxID=4076 RepID=A0ABS8SC68_DATST|nr:hypothetical protein [Datura stramonium]
MGGDFNEILRASDKWGGTLWKRGQLNSYLSCLNYCNMDMGLPRAINWTNKRFKDKSILISERLDRFFATNVGLLVIQMLKESDGEEDLDEEFEECDSSDRRLSLMPLLPKTSWKVKKVKDAMSQHR